MTFNQGFNGTTFNISNIAIPLFTLLQKTKEVQYVDGA